MNLVIDSILDENLAYYRGRKGVLVGRVLINGKGSVIRRKIKNNLYVYLKRKVQGRHLDTYIGPEGSWEADHARKKAEKTKRDVEELRVARHALKRLRAKNINTEDFAQHIKDLFSLMDKDGLWDEGLQLIGSWCFKVYQNYFGVEYYPERTIDLDFAISIPYKGSPVKLGEKIKRLGFEEEVNRADGTIAYVSSDMKIEFLRSRKGSGKREGSPYMPDLDIAPQAVPFLDILLKYPRTEKLRDLGKVTVPSMGAFLVHKLIVAAKRKDQRKKTKDYRQAYLVAQAILWDERELDRVCQIIGELHKKRQKMMFASSKEAVSFVPGAHAMFARLWEVLEHG
ncbi:MAG: GSU2403 family nucleotidyltransferase fold protein [Desulfohalobiaceae bacterium]